MQRDFDREPREISLEQAVRVAGPWITQMAVERFGIDPKRGLNQVIEAALQGCAS